MQARYPTYRSSIQCHQTYAEILAHVIPCLRKVLLDLNLAKRVGFVPQVLFTYRHHCSTCTFAAWAPRNAKACGREHPQAFGAQERPIFSQLSGSNPMPRASFLDHLPRMVWQPVNQGKNLTVVGPCQSIHHCLVLGHSRVLKRHSIVQTVFDV